MTNEQQAPSQSYRLFVVTNTGSLLGTIVFDRRADAAALSGTQQEHIAEAWKAKGSPVHLAPSVELSPIGPS
ncbi:MULTISPECIES: hypothetical protein [unclassified Chelatococcus]|uniref:hypothetical protein n=1 Tax=unclassified Chelatococcus TaxID=2638111 RepID=UPI001BD0F251|nr:MULTISPECIES: hypothetical protein [unclassified Chelatococcus]MBS7698395.1 hypothetical protein [Chelatococcus sp. YT9]MBX3558838.1 hypothetical protein [Chelatococcus sp.]